ncbi:MAG: lipopolysaccharide assembly protein LapB, partial [Pseudomonadota bacterium]|nr:lipopolysaccharide assembly protein LapB [Pseudomonadota bacterium]
LGKSSSRLPNAYFKGLNFLLNEQPDKAIQVFLEAVEVDSETVEMHLALGNLYRRRGEIERATRIHQNLVARTDLDKDLRAHALYELAQDYLKAGLFDRAENLFQELREASEYQDQACRHLLQIYDQEKEWRSAMVIAEEMYKSGSGQNAAELVAQYSCELAEKALAEGRYQEASHYLEQAFRYEPRSVRAAIQSGRVAALNGDHRRAIEIWQGLQEQSPEFLGEIADHLANSYRVLGDAEGYRAFLKSAVEENHDSRLVAALVRMIHTQQGSTKAEHFLVAWLRRNPSLEGLHQLVSSRLSHAAPGENEDLVLLEDLISGVLRQDRDYLCRNCGFSGNTLHWQCPGCKSWNTMTRKRAGESRRAKPNFARVQPVKAVAGQPQNALRPALDVKSSQFTPGVIRK